MLQIWYTTNIDQVSTSQKTDTLSPKGDKWKTNVVYQYVIIFCERGLIQWRDLRQILLSSLVRANWLGFEVHGFKVQTSRAQKTFSKMDFGIDMDVSGNLIFKFGQNEVKGKASTRPNVIKK